MDPKSVLCQALRRAGEAEENLRLTAFLADREQINGVTVRLLTLRMLGLLVLINSPFVTLRSSRPTEEDIFRLLWIVSPGLIPPDGKSDKWFSRFIRRIIRRPSMDDRRVKFIREVMRHPGGLNRFSRAIYRYLWRMRMDSPPVAGGGRRISASWIAATVHKIASVYGWPDEVLDSLGRPIPGAGIMDKPMPRIYQYLKWIDFERDSETPQFHPFTSFIRGRYRERQNGKGQRNGEPVK